MERWKWFESYNALGKWILVDGYAEVTRTAEKLDAVLRISLDTPHHSKISAAFTGNGNVKATVEGNYPTFELEGVINSGESPEGDTMSVILTDGFTVIGLTYGPWSDQDNLSAFSDT